MERQDSKKPAPEQLNNDVRVDQELMASKNASIIRKAHNVPSTQKALTKEIWFNVTDPIETFTGRKQYLKDLHTQILSSREKEETITVLSQITEIPELGGIGKTETARMYVNYYGKTYNHVVWIDSEHHSIAEAQFRALAANELKIPAITNEFDDKPKSRLLPEILKDLYQTLCYNGNLLLLVFDNAESLDDVEKQNDGIRRFLPPTLSSAFVKPTILLTSRNQNWGYQKVLPLGLWTDDECLLFLLNQRNLQNKEDKRSVIELADVLERIPLALEIAAALVREQSKQKRNSKKGGDYGVQELINDYQSGKREIMTDHLFSSYSRTKTTLLILWNVVLNKIKSYYYGKLAFKVLHVMAYLAPTIIPKDFLSFLFEEVSNDLTAALELLTRYSLIHEDKDHFTMHRMIQEVTIEDMKYGVRNQQGVHKVYDERYQYFCDEKTTLTDLLSKLEKYLPTLSQESKVYDDLIANIIYVSDYVSDKLSIPQYLKFTEFVAEHMKEIRMDAASVYFENLIAYSTIVSGHRDPQTHHYRKRLTQILYLKGQYDQVFQNYKELLKEEEMGGTSEETIVETKHSIAQVLCNLERYEEALKIYEDVLKVEERIHGVEHPSTLTTNHKMATVLNSQGKFKEAQTLHEKVLVLRTKVLGVSHQDTLASKLCIAVLLGKQDKWEEAMKINQEVLEIQDKVLGCKHLSCLRTKRRIASVLENQFKYDQALKLNREVLKHAETLLGPNHLASLTVKLKIASNLDKLEKYDEALKAYSELLEEGLKVLCFGHALIIKTKDGIAHTLKNLGRYDQAVKAFNEVLELSQAILGKDHPDTLATKYGLATVLDSQGQYDKALETYTQVQETREVVLGSGHLDSLTAKHSIANMLVTQGKYDEALKILEEMQEAQEKSLGANHPSTLKTKLSILDVMKRQGKSDEVLGLYKELLVVEEKELGIKHRLTLETKYNLGAFYVEKGNFDEAAKLLEEVMRLRKELFGPEHKDYLEAKRMYEKCPQKQPIQPKQPPKQPELIQEKSKSCCTVS